MPSVKNSALRILNSVLRNCGVELRRITVDPVRPLDDLEPWLVDIVAKVRPYTMTSTERISALCHAVRYVARSQIAGDIVECGVWRGGSIMAAALTLLQERELRTLHLFDTFEGMTPPSSVDRAIKFKAKPASLILEESDRTSEVWAYATLDEVRTNLASTGYPTTHIRYVRGKVEETLPTGAPDKISILRLDTDWYESTRWELIHLYPRLAVGGVLIIDDYSFWEGSKKATDEYISENRLPILLQRIDSEARIAVKLENPERRTAVVEMLTTCEGENWPQAALPSKLPV